MPHDVKLKTVPTEFKREGDVWVVQLPRFGPEGTHYHTLGLLTPYFEGLTKGRLMGTFCPNEKCPAGHGNGEMWLPPRADCPDCHQPMQWKEVEKLDGYIYSYTYVERGGAGLEIECPYYQVDVRLPGVMTILKGYLLDRKSIKIGDKVRAVFRTGDEVTNTCLDVAWELI